MSEQFFLSLQQNIKLMIWAPILSTLFRIVFMIVYNPYSSWKGRWQSAIGALRYGFWWGMEDVYKRQNKYITHSIPYWHR